MQGIIDQSFSINLNVLTMLHLYRSKNAKNFNKPVAYFLYCIFVVLVPFLSLLYFFLGEELDTLQINFNGIFVAETLGFVTKLLPFIVKEQEIRRCINYFGKPYFKPQFKQEEKILARCIRICNRNSTIMFYLNASGIISWSLIPLLRGGHKLPVDIWLPFNANEDVRVYYAVYIFLNAGVAYVGFAGCIVDPLIAGLTYIAASHLIVLQYKIQQIASNTKRNTYKNITNCIKYHNAVLRFVELYEECFSYAIFSQFAASAFVICFSCLQLYLMSVSNLNTVFLSITCIIIALIQIYLYCYFGTLLFEENNNLANAIYMTDWYDYDIKSQKSLLTLMECSNKSLTVTAGKILDLSLNTFTMVLKRSYSLIAVLKNYQ